MSNILDETIMFLAVQVWSETITEDKAIEMLAVMNNVSSSDVKDNDHSMQSLVDITNRLYARRFEELLK